MNIIDLIIVRSSKRLVNDFRLICRTARLRALNRYYVIPILNNFLAI
jgi:hypothetical protein